MTTFTVTKKELIAKVKKNIKDREKRIAKLEKQGKGSSYAAQGNGQKINDCECILMEFRRGRIPRNINHICAAYFGKGARFEQ